MASGHDNCTFGQTEEETIKEDEELEQAQDRCKKKTKHCEKNKYQEITKDYKFEELLEDQYKTSELSSLLKHMSRSTGRIKVGTIYCTGFVQAIRQGVFQKYPCSICQGNLQNGGRGYILTVTTALHVVERASDQCLGEMELSWHQDDPPFKLTAHLHRIVDTDKGYDDRDWCAAEFITHDMDKVAKLKENLEMFQKLQGDLYKKFKNQQDKLVFIVSYPHGSPKQVIHLGKVKDKHKLKHIHEDQEWCRYSYDAPTCKGSSGAPVFILGQPLCGFGYWFGHPHHHSRWKESEEIGYSSVGCDHIDRE